MKEIGRQIDGFAFSKAAVGPSPYLDDCGDALGYEMNNCDEVFLGLGKVRLKISSIGKQ